MRANAKENKGEGGNGSKEHERVNESERRERVTTTWRKSDRCPSFTCRPYTHIQYGIVVQYCTGGEVVVICADLSESVLAWSCRA